MRCFGLFVETLGGGLESLMAGGVFSKNGMIPGGEFCPVVCEDFFHVGVAGEVGPFVGIAFAIVEFLRAIDIVNVAIVL